MILCKIQIIEQNRGHLWPSPCCLTSDLEGLLIVTIAVSGVTILLSLTVFLLLVAETMPPTSDAVPLIGEVMPHQTKITQSMRTNGHAWKLGDVMLD